MSQNAPHVQPDPNPGTGHHLQLLVVGSGGREHALAWKLAESPRVARVYVAPGNGGTDGPKDHGRIQNLDIAARDSAGLVAAAQRLDIDLVIIGPEAALADGLVDMLSAEGIAAFGPRKVAAQLECSKAFAKEFMRRHGIPTANATIVESADQARAWIAAHPGPVVVKASGLAAGKGVFICETSEEAEIAVSQLMEQRLFADAGATVLLEERLVGEEISVLAFCDGRTALPMPAAQDHKRAFDGDLGPNTGGMGAFAPAPCADAETLRRIHHEILLPVISGMRAEAYPYVGILFAGVMLTADGPKVLEFNCRFGDPETEALLLLLESDLVEVIMACVDGRLRSDDVRWRNGSAATVVLASAGYPGTYGKGMSVAGLEQAAQIEGVHLFHAGTQRRSDDLVTAGGRVFAVSAVADTLADALARSYAACDRIRYDGKQLRRDIGARALSSGGSR